MSQFSGSSPSSAANAIRRSRHLAPQAEYTTQGILPRLERAALAYTRLLGWQVIPIVPGGKPPLGRLVPHGVHDATADPARIRAWWAEEPEANIGIACGPDSGFWTLDLDPRNGGEGTWEDLLYKFGKGSSPDTVTAETGGGGLHYLFRWPGDGRLPKRSPGSGLDVKGAGGYIVAAPSIHPSGELYRWQEFCHPLKVAVADAPEWLLELVCTPATHCVAPAGHNLKTWAELMAPAHEGVRNERLARVAGILFRRLPAPVAVVLACLWAKNNTVPPLSDQEVRRTLDSIAQREAKRLGGTS